MEINWEFVGRAIVGSIPIVAAIVGFLRGPGVLRTRLNHDVDLLGKLPADSGAHARLLAKIDRQLQVIETIDRDACRDTSGAVIAFFLIVGFLGAALWLWSFDAWWGYISAVGLAIFALAGIASMLESLELVPRDDKGRKQDA